MAINTAVPKFFTGLGNALISLPKMATGALGTVATTVARGVGELTGSKELKASAKAGQQGAVDVFQSGAKQLGTGVKGTLDGVKDVFVP